MKIGLFGGSFNPVHNAHFFIAEEVLNQFNLDYLYFIPAYRQPFKSSSKMFDEHKRLKLLQSAIKNKRIKISEYEIKNQNISFTYKTIKNFQNEGKLYLIIGADSANDFNKWKKYKFIIDGVEKIIVFPRLDYKKNDILKKWDYKKGKLHFLDSLILEISSTEIRKRIQNEKPYRYLVPEKVFNIISKKGYYK